MKFIFLMMLSLVSAEVSATPNSFTCDDNGPLGLGMLRRIDFVRTEGNEYKMTVYKEKQGDCCRYLKKQGEALVDLIESPTRFGTLVSPENETNLDITISYPNKKCRIKGLYSGGAPLNFRGKLLGD